MMDSNYERALRVAGYLPNTREDRVKAMVRQAIECAEGRCSCDAEIKAAEEQETAGFIADMRRVEGDDIEAMERRHAGS